MHSRTARRYLPPEWAPQSGTLLTWPHAKTDWAKTLERVESVYLVLTSHISRRQRALIVCHDHPHLAHVRERLADAQIDLHRITLHVSPSNDTWARDHGPITVLERGQPRLLDFRFNGWGGKHQADLDNLITSRLHQNKAFGTTPREAVDLVLEGGSIEVDGAGTLLTTRRCTLSPTRNPSLTVPALEERFNKLFGVERILWLQQGSIPGDDTDGHIDTLARFCDEHTIAYASPHENDECAPALVAMRNELAAFRTRAGRPYRLVPLPCPAPIYDSGGQRLPATYANFLIINGTVLVPCYQDPADREALERMAICFPEREIVAVDARLLVNQGGSIHCSAMHLPAGVLDS
ncbi:MAG: agmatine/peptidylarginine deiminase [Acidiferrobacterales bacterium]